MHQFFQGSGQQQQYPQEQSNMTRELQNNLIVLEIYNNWEYAKELFFKMINGELKQVDSLETSWISYINSNGLDLRNYKNSNDFVEKHIRALSAEELKE